MSDFDWDEIAEAVVIPEQAATAVYENPEGNIVIRQAGRYGPAEDVWIIIAPEHAGRLAEAIRQCAERILNGDEDDADSPAPTQRRRPMTPAERKRRQRRKQRDMSRENVTARDGMTERSAGDAALPFAPPIDADEVEALAS